MLKGSFLVLWIILVFGEAQAQGAVEIYANGHKFESLQDYWGSKKSVAVHSDLHQFYVLSVENGMTGALRAFYHAQGQPGFQKARRISADQLQEAIARAVASSEDPKLLISRPGKVRIMALKVQ